MTVTMSALARVLTCPASAVLPHTRQAEESVWQSKGRVVHAFLRDCLLLGVDEALARVPDEHREVCEGLELSELPVAAPESWVPEVAFAYDWQADAAREIDRGVDSRDYGAGPTEIAGRADVAGVTHDDAVAIVDYKTGYRWLGSAYDSWQMRGYALAAARAWDKLRAVVSYCRILDNGRPWYLRAALDALDLDATAARIRQRLQLVERLRERQGEALEAAPEVERHAVAGPHCRYCAAFARCPEQRALLAEVVREAAASDVALPALTPETAPLVYERWKLARDVLERVGEALEAWAETSPIALDSGLVYGPVKVPREKLDPVRGAAALAVRYGPELAEWAIETTSEMTKASLERGLRKWMQHHKGHRITKLKEEALDVVRQAGASRVSHRTQTREHRPGIPTEEE